MSPKLYSKTLHSKDYHNFLNNVIDNELSTTTLNNETLWVAMGNQLEIEGVEKFQISTIVRKDIEDILWQKQFKDYMPREEYRYTNSKYFEAMKENGWTNPYMARNVNLDPHMDQKNGSIYTRNRRMMVLCDELIDICRTMKEKSKDKNTPILEDVFGIKYMREFYMQRMVLVINCKNSIDSKTKVPKNTELFLLECLATVLGSVNKCAQVFMEKNLIRLKEQGKFLTSKQATKFQKGGKQSQLNILIPKTRDPSVFLGCSGVQCSCGGWNVKEMDNPNDIECYDCGKVIPNAHTSKCEYCQIPLYKERLVWMVKHNNKCQNCETKNDLPEELIVYAKS